MQPETTGRPLFFHHIPKTGGTSVINALRALTPAGLAFTEANNALSKDYTERLAAGGLPPAALVHGHPGWGACRPFRGRARFITLLREPSRHLVSHYLHAVRDPALPQHAAAKALGFEQFLRIYRHTITFQTNALYLSITDPDTEMRRALQDPDCGSAFQTERYFAAQLPVVFAFLDEMLAVGTLEAVDDFMISLAEAAGWNHVPALRRDNAAGAKQQAAAVELLGQVADLAERSDLASLFAIERTSYCRAASLAGAARLRSLRARMRQGAASGPAAHFRIHGSALGEIVLGENFAPEPPGGEWWDHATAAPSVWWTQERQISVLYVRCIIQAPCRLVISADRLHFVTADEVLLCCAGQWLALSTDREAEGRVAFSAEIGPAGHPGAFCELLLYLQWNRYPSTAPYYPALRIADVRLSAAAS